MRKIQIHRHLSTDNNEHLAKAWKTYGTFTYDCPCGELMLCHLDGKCRPMMEYMEDQRKERGLPADAKAYSVDL